MRPFSVTDRHDVPGLIFKHSSCIAAVIDYVVVGLEDAVLEPILAHELPEVFDRVQVEGLRRQRQDGDVAGDHKTIGHVPARLIHDENSMRIIRPNDGRFRPDVGSLRRCRTMAWPAPPPSRAWGRSPRRCRPIWCVDRWALKGAFRAWPSGA